MGLARLNTIKGRQVPSKLSGMNEEDELVSEKMSTCQSKLSKNDSSGQLGSSKKSSYENSKKGKGTQ